MRRLLLWLLLVLVPAGNLQMVCFDHPGVAPSAGKAVTGADRCADLCPRDAAAPVDTGCVLIAGGCSVLLAAVVTLHDPVAGLHPPRMITPVVPAAAGVYVAPPLASFNPPPEL
ncbi:MAG TPA: hypothetical protein VM364_20730 [Vicinamibacterales bacterium]|nr:hypothetical protein [Vicinamibacterales bacterium]